MLYQAAVTHHVQPHGQPATSLNIIKIKTEVLAEGAGVAGSQGQQRDVLPRLGHAGVTCVWGFPPDFQYPAL